MDVPNHYMKSLWSYLIHFHNIEELKQINSFLSVSLALSELNRKEENGKFIYKCRCCGKSYPTVPDMIKHLHIAHSSQLYETCERGNEVVDLTQDENNLS